MSRTGQRGGVKHRRRDGPDGALSCGAKTRNAGRRSADASIAMCGGITMRSSPHIEEISGAQQSMPSGAAGRGR